MYETTGFLSLLVKHDQFKNACHVRIVAMLLFVPVIYFTTIAEYTEIY